MKRSTSVVGTSAGVLLLSLLGTSTASAADCIPTPPVWESVIDVPAVPGTDAETHDEHRYGRTVVTPAIPAVPAVEEQSHLEYRYTRTVVVTPAVPGTDAVTKTETRWSKSTYIKGWERTDTEPRKVVTQEYVPGSPAVDAVVHDEYRFGRTVVVTPYQPGSPAVDAVIGTREVTPEIPYAPAEYSTVVITPAVPAVPEVAEVSHTEYQWKWWGTAQHGKTVWTDGSYPKDRPNSAPGEWRKNGQTKKVVDVAYVPGKPAVPAVTKEVLVKAEQPHVPATYEDYEISPAIPAVPEVAEVTERQETDWVLTAPEGDGWEQIDHRVVEDSAAVPAVPAVPEQSHLLYEHARTVVVTPAVPGTPEVTKEETTDLLAEAPEGEGWTVVEGSETKVVDVVGVPEVPEVPEVRDEQETDWLVDAPEGDDWTVIETRTVEDKAATEGTDAILGWDLVSPGTVCTPEVVVVTTPPLTNTVTNTVTLPGAPALAQAAPYKAKHAAPAAEGSDEGLAHTGADPLLAGGLAAAALLAGAGAVAVARRRSSER